MRGRDRVNPRLQETSPGLPSVSNLGGVPEQVTSHDARMALYPRGAAGG